MTAQSPRRRILFVTPVVPRPDAHNGGARVMAGTIAAVSTLHDVGVVGLRENSDQDLGPLASVCRVAELVEHPFAKSAAGRLRRRARLAAGLAGGCPLWPGRWWVPGFSERLRRVVQSWKPDIVQFEYHVMGQYASALSCCGAGRVLVEHDPGAAAARDAAGSSPMLMSLLAAADRHAWQRYQRRIMRQVDRVVVFTERDRTVLLPDAGATPIECIPFGVTIPARAANPTGDLPSTVLFVGSFQHYPNHEAARRLVQHIFPAVRAAFPQARLVIAGSDPPRWLLEGAESVDVIANMSDLRPLLEAAAIVVAPLNLGGGMRVKVLEALAAGKALVCSRLAVEGLTVRNGHEVQLADSDHQFSEHLVALLRSPDRRVALATSARRWAETHATWAAAAEAFNSMYVSLLQERSAVGSPVQSGISALSK